LKTDSGYPKDLIVVVELLVNVVSRLFTVVEHAKNTSQ